MSTRTLQYALNLLKPLLTASLACGLMACQGSVALSPTLTGGMWSNSYMATFHGRTVPQKVTPADSKPVPKSSTSTQVAQTVQPVAAPPRSSCPLSTVVFEANQWNEMLPPSQEFGQSSLDFIKTIYNKSCQPILQPVHTDRMAAVLPQGLNPGSVVVLGQGNKRIAALVKKCSADGTCQALARLPDKVYTIKFNINYPHVYQNNRGEVINTLLKIPGSQQVATAGELLLEAHQAYGRGVSNNAASLATANDD